MKTIILALTMAAATSLAAQPSFEQAMAGALAQLDTATGQEWVEAANRIERIAQAEPAQWLPAYYASYCHAVLFYYTKDPKAQEEHAKQAEEWLGKAKALNSEHSEVITLEAFVTSVRLSQDPMSLGATLGPKVGQLLRQAIQKDPNNPRAHYLLGQNTYYTPAAFGGGADKALPYLEKAVELFKEEEAGPLMPHWGEAQAEKILAQCQADLKK